ncbi:sugar ABC transporter substrate-binding protein [Nocardia rhamnosiphila]
MKRFERPRSGVPGWGAKSTARSAGVAVLAVLALTACGSGGGGSDGGSGPADVDQAALDEVLYERYELPYPMTPTDLGEARNVTYINLGVAAGGNAEVQQVRKEILEKSGWNIDGPYDGKFTPSVQATLIEQAVLEGTDAIILDSIFPSTVPAAIQSARDAGIPIVCNACMPEESSDGVYVIGSSAESLSENQIPMVLAAVGKDDATIVLVAAEYESNKASAKVQRALIEDQCSQCEIVEIPFASSDLGKPSVPSFTNLLREYPPGEIDAVITPFSPATTSLITVAEQSGRDDFKIINTYGDAPLSTQIKEGQFAPLLFGDVIVSQAFISYAAVDTLARVFNGQEVPDYSNLPAAPIAKQNAADYVDENGLWAPEELESKFFEQWGM